MVGDAHLRLRRAAEQTMAMPLAAERVWTADDVRALPDDPHNRYECVDGVLLVSPSPRRSHQQCVTALSAALFVYAMRTRVGSVIVAPSDVELDARTLVEPDIYIVPLVDNRFPRNEDVEETPILVVEVLSTSTRRHDQVVKRPRYQRAGIECWLVDLESRQVERWMPTADRPDVLVDELTWHPADAPDAFQLSLSAFFAMVLGD